MKLLVVAEVIQMKDRTEGAEQCDVQMCPSAHGPLDTVYLLICFSYMSFSPPLDTSRVKMPGHNENPADFSSFLTHLLPGKGKDYDSKIGSEMIRNASQSGSAAAA